MTTADLSLRVIPFDLDDEEVDRCIRELFAEIREADVERVVPAAEAAPNNTKSGEAFAVGALVVTLAPIALSSVMTIVASWLSRQRREIEIEIDGQRLRAPIGKEQVNRIVDAYLRRLEER